MPENDSRRPQKEKLSLDRSDWMAILAVFISSGAFFVSLFEANIMKEQQEIMQSQQKASVWPYMEARLVLDVDTVYSNFSLNISNMGVGPAKIKHFTLYINDEIVRDYNMIGDKLQALEDDGRTSIAHSYIPPIGVLSANDSKTILEIKKPHNNRLDLNMLNFKNFRVSYELCYCSIFG